MSIEELDSTIPVRPPVVNKKIKPRTHKKLTENFVKLP